MLFHLNAGKRQVELLQEALQRFWCIARRSSGFHRTILDAAPSMTCLIDPES